MPDSNITALTQDLAPALVDLLYLAKSPFGPTDDRKVTLQSIADLISTTSVTLQEAYDSGNTIALTVGTPITITAADALSSLTVQSEGATNAFISTDRYFTGSGGPGFIGRHARGTLATPTALLSGDTLGALGGP